MYSTIAKILEAKKMTFADLSKLSGVAGNVFSNLKARGGNLSAENMVKVAKALNIPMELLFEG